MHYLLRSANIFDRIKQDVRYFKEGVMLLDHRVLFLQESYNNLFVSQGLLSA